MSTKKNSRDEPSARIPLSHQRIVAEALSFVDDEGLTALSMRGLAARLGVEPMSLYHWFASRDHLLDALLDAFVSDIVVPATGPWQERLTAAALLFRAAARRHPGLVPFVVVHRFNTERTLSLLEQVLGAVAEVHDDPSTRAAAFRLWIHWLIGFCLDEASGFSKGPSAQSPPSDEQVRERFPRVAALGPFNRREHFDALFSRGLAAVLVALSQLERKEC